MKMGRRVLAAMREVTREERVESEKELYKQRMWSKVSSWLADYDQAEPKIATGQTTIAEKLKAIDFFEEDENLSKLSN